MHAKGGAAPRSRNFDGAGGIRTALFETLEWPSPPRDVLSMRDLIIGPGAVAMLSSTRENFALVIESAEYAEMQRNLFEVLWSASVTEPPALPR